MHDSFDGRPDHGYIDLDEPWSAASPRRRWGLVLSGVAAVAVVMAVCGVGLFLVRGKGDKPRYAGNDQALPATSPSASSAPTSVAPSQTEAAVPPVAPTSAPASTRPPKPRVTPSKNPKASVPAPPPVAQKTAPPGCTPKTTGPQAPYTEVRAALKTAAGHTYWRSVPSIQVPERLLQAVAMTESTWRSNVLACDGGIGLMQVMPDTVKQINNRFGTTWDVSTPQGNAHLGANYLAWATRYMGDVYFGGSYDLTDPALLDAVIAAYNHGAAAVDPTKGTAGIPNWPYVNRVKGYMANCPCDAW